MRFAGVFLFVCLFVFNGRIKNKLKKNRFRECEIDWSGEAGNAGDSVKLSKEIFSC